MRKSFSLLVLLSLICAFLWRIEIELRWGWAGLDWLSSFHYSALVICFLFSLWLHHCAPCSRARDSVGRSMLAFCGGLASYVSYYFAFSMIYGPFAAPVLRIISLVIILIAIPLGVCILAKRFSITFPKFYWLLVPLLFAASFLLSSILLLITNHPGGADPIHAIKSGFIFIGFVIAAGLPFLGFQKTEQPVDSNPH